LIQFFKVRFIDKGILSLRQRDAAIWINFGQPAQVTTSEAL
jgi:hypothetical protein